MKMTINENVINVDGVRSSGMWNFKESVFIFLMCIICSFAFFVYRNGGVLDVSNLVAHCRVCLNFGSFKDRTIDLSFIDNYTTMFHEAIVDSVMCGHTHRRTPRVSVDDRVTVVDGNRLYNVRTINKYYHHWDSSFPVMHGYTIIDNVRYNFPVFCDKKTAIRVHENLSSLQPERIRAFHTRNLVDYEILAILRPFFAPVLWSHPVLMGGFECSQAMHFSFNTIGGAVGSYLFGVTLWPYVILTAIVELLGLTGDSVLYVILEEILNQLYGVSSIIVFETVSRMHISALITLVPMFIHVVLSFLPFPLRILLHWLWNRAAYNSLIREYSCSVADRTGDVFFVLDFIRKLLAKDFTGLVLSYGMAFPRISNFRRLLEPQDSNVDFVALSDVLMTEDDVVTLSSEESKSKYNFIFQWIPTHISRSSTFSKVVALAIIVFQSRFFFSWEPLTQFGKYVTDEDFLFKGDLVTTVFTAMKSVYNGLHRMIEQRDWTAFWEMPRDAYFVSTASKLLYPTSQTKVKEDVLNNMALARELVDSRLYLTNSPEITRMLSSLRQYEVTQSKFLDATSQRTPPIVIWFNGPPGTGKTNLMECLKDFFAARDGCERFPGDTISFDINDKYPTSTGANKDAVFLVMNDIPALYVDFPTRDLLPLDVILQRMFDTCPLSFRAAAVEDKGLVLNKIKYVFVSSNHQNFKCPGETEKLQRRLEGGILVDVSVVDKAGKNLSYDKFKGFSQAERNGSWRFQLLSVGCTGNFITFTKTEKTLRLADFLAYSQDRVDQADEFNQLTKDKFQEGCVRCPCGMPEAIHILPMVPGVSVWTNPGKTVATYVCFTSKCSDVARSCAYVNPYLEIPKVGSVEPVETVAAGSIMAIASWANFFSHTLPFFPFLGPLYSMLVLIALFINRESIEGLMMWLARDRVRELYWKIEESSLTNDIVYKVVSNIPVWTEDVRVKFMLRAKRTYWKIRRWLIEYQVYLGAGSIAALLAAWYLKNGSVTYDLNGRPIYPEQVRPESIHVDVPRREMSFPLEKRREWSKQDTEINVSSVITVGAGVKDLEMMLRKSVRDMVMTFKGFTPIDVKVAIVSPQYCMLNKHYVQKDGKFRGEEFTLEWNGVSFPFEMKSGLYDDTTEFIVFRHTFPIVPHSLFRFFPSSFIRVATDVIHVKETGSTEHVAVPSSALSYQTLEWCGYSGNKGDCMEGVIAPLKQGAVIAGFIGYKRNFSDFGGCFPVSREWYDRMVSRDPIPHVNAVTLNGLPSDCLEDLSVNAELRNVPTPYFFSLGTVPGPSRSFSSSLRKTRLYDDVSPYLSEPHGVPRKLRIIAEIEGEPTYLSAFTTTHKNINYSCNLRQSETFSAIDSYLSRVANVRDVKTKGISLSPLTLSEAFFGCPQLGIERIDFNTSVGPLLKAHGMKNKFDAFVDLNEQREGFPKYDLSPVMSGMINMYDALFKNGEVPTPLVDLVPKDEVRPISKLDVAKIRLFCVLDAAFNIYARMYLMPLIVYLLQYRDLSECYGAMNAGSSQWNDLVNRLKKDSRFYFDMDFSTFDVSHGAPAFDAAAEFFYRLALRLGYDEQSATIVYYIFECFKWQIGKYGNDFFIKMKGMPSGAIFTLIMNSFINSFLIRVAYLRLVGSLDSFDAQVDTANVGDDNVNSVSGKIIERFNMITIAVEYRRLGYVATPANKNSQMQKFLSFEELSFLKRSFVWSQELGVYLAPISKDSIYKAFCFDSRDQAISSVQRLLDVSKGAQREAFLHGKEFFCEFQERMATTFRKHQMELPLLDYDKLKEEYLEGVFSTYMLGRDMVRTTTQNYVPVKPKLLMENKKGLELCMVVLFMFLWFLVRHNDPASVIIVKPHPPHGFTGPWCVVQSVADFNSNSSPSGNTALGDNADVVQSEVTVKSSVITRIPPSLFGRDEFANWLSHPLQLSHITWTSTTGGAVLFTDLVASWLSAMPTNLANKIATFYFLKSTIRLKFVVQGAPYAAGQMVVAAMPRVTIPGFNFVATTRLVNDTNVNAKVLPHVALDPSKTTTYELDLPVCTPNGVWTLKGNAYGSYELYTAMYNPLISGTATAPSVAICIYMSMIDPEVDGLTLLSNDFVEEKKEGGTVSTFLKATSSFLPAVGAIFPSLSPTTTLFSAVTGAAGDLLYHFGFSKPPQVENEAVLLNRQQDNYSQFDGKSSSIVLAGSQKTSLGLSETLAGGDYGDMLIENIIRRKAIVANNVVVSPADATGTLVGTYSVDPTFTLINKFPTPLAGIASMFYYWTGDIEVEIEIIASVFHRATLVVAWDPLANATSATPTMSDAITTLKNVTINVSGNTSVKIDVPWKQSNPWGLVQPLHTALADATKGNGLIYIWVLNPVVSNGSADGISLNVYYSSFNMAFAAPAPANLGGASYAVTPLSNDFVPITGESFGPKTDLSLAFVRSFGEPIYSIKQLACRMNGYAQAELALTNAQAIRLSVANVPMFPNTTITTIQANLLGWLSGAFLGYRGGLRWSAHSDVFGVGDGTAGIFPSRQVQLAMAEHSIAVQTVPWSSIVIPVANHNSAEYAWMGNNQDVAQRTDVVAPQMLPFDFVPSTVAFTQCGDAVRFSLSTEGAGPAYCWAAVGAADDAQFVQFLGFPALA